PFLLLSTLNEMKNENCDLFFAGDIVYPLASAAYGDQNAQQQCLDKHLPGAKLSLRAEVPCDKLKEDTCSGFTFIDEGNKRIGLVFRRPSKTAARSDRTSMPHLKQWVDYDIGYISNLNSTIDFQVWGEGGLGDDIVRLSSAHPDYALYITGHSLGGSMSALAAVRVAKNGIHPNQNIIFYNFGEPRTGDKKFANLLDSLVQGYRVVHDKDIIPHTPFPFMGYHHHQTEVFYENDMTLGSPYVVCQGQEDPNCSARYQSDLNLLHDHFHYFNINVV
ncbi:hypothetical protein PMAYCL1PPCAC_01136, partial [Pristionchus mayeri]